MKKNFNSVLKGGKLSIALQILNLFRNAKIIGILLFFTSIFYSDRVSGQQICGFDEYIHPLMQQNPQYFEEMELQLQQAMEQLNRQGSQTPITIPVIFHIMHTGVNSTTNIDYSRIQTAIVSLNADFANSNIQFCLAIRDPQGNPVPNIAAGDIAGEIGVKRVNGSQSGYTGSMTLGGSNEPIIKGLSYFGNFSYLNVWVVGDILTGGAGTTAGFAYFPNTSPSNLDGITMDKDFLGYGNWHVLSHEAGHFLNLYHTFEGDCPPGADCNANNCSATICPLNVDCENQGDRICDTRPHKRSCGNCLPNGQNACDNNSSNALFVHNHMDYSTEICRNTFTDNQNTKMMAALMTFRPGLSTSLGCVQACNPILSLSLLNLQQVHCKLDKM
ncbi:MAG: hypothetical protein IPO92_00470 [Saprospiraceae bacterium]|nr:hypothetical protein [Saprospiraceae bacterium]